MQARAALLASLSDLSRPQGTGKETLHCVRVGDGPRNVRKPGGAREQRPGFRRGEPLYAPTGTRAVGARVRRWTTKRTSGACAWSAPRRAEPVASGRVSHTCCQIVARHSTPSSKAKCWPIQSRSSPPKVEKGEVRPPGGPGVGTPWVEDFQGVPGSRVAVHPVRHDHESRVRWVGMTSNSGCTAYA